MILYSNYFREKEANIIITYLPNKKEFNTDNSTHVCPTSFKLYTHLVKVTVSSCTLLITTVTSETI